MTFEQVVYQEAISSPVYIFKFEVACFGSGKQSSSNCQRPLRNFRITDIP